MNIYIYIFLFGSTVLFSMKQSFRFISAEVRRRGTYKGKIVKKNETFNVPMDCCSSAGILLILATFFNAKGLTMAQIQTGTGIMDKLESLVHISAKFSLLPNHEGCSITICRNEFDLSEIKEFIPITGVSLARWDGVWFSQVSKFSCLFLKTQKLACSRYIAPKICQPRDAITQKGLYS